MSALFWLWLPTLFQRAGPWPTNISEWLTAIVAVFVILGGLGTLSGWYLRNLMNRMGRRFAVTEKECSEEKAKNEVFARHLASLDLKVADLERVVGIYQGLAGEVGTRLTMRIDREHERDLRLENRLATIESQNRDRREKPS